MPVTIERVTDLESAFPILVTLLEELHDYHMPFWPRPFVPDWQERWRGYIRLDDDRCILLARVDGEPVGYINAGIVRNPGLFQEAFGHIDDAYVRPGVQRLGIGGDMLGRVELWCRSRGVEEMRLGVVAANHAGLSFWEKSGFSPLTHTMTKRLTSHT